MQVLASMANNLQILDYGLTMAIPSIVIAALTGMNDDMNANEYVRVTGLQASWLGTYQACQIISKNSLNPFTFTATINLYSLNAHRQHHVYRAACWQSAVHFIVGTVRSQDHHVLGKHCTHHRIRLILDGIVDCHDLCGLHIAWNRCWHYRSAE